MPLPRSIGFSITARATANALAAMREFPTPIVGPSKLPHFRGRWLLEKNSAGKFVCALRPELRSDMFPGFLPVEDDRLAPACEFRRSTR